MNTRPNHQSQAKGSDYGPDAVDHDDYLDSDSDTQECSRESKFNKGLQVQIHPHDTFPKLRRRKSEILRTQYINSKEIRICVGTWNLGGEVPPDDLDIDNWIDINDPADIYVLGFQEIVPLDAGIIIGAEDSRLVKKWENIIGETLKRIRHKTKIKCFSDPPSPAKFKPFEDVAHKLTRDDAPSSIACLASLDLDSVIKRRRRSSYVKLLSKQMVGVFITIWVRRGLHYHIKNVQVSTVGVGVSYIGNKGSISVSMSIYETLFCFICTHLTSGETEENKLKRNADVHEIHRRTLFPSMSGIGLPRSIYDHERIIWLGDLNYRLNNLSYEKTKEFISEKRWSDLFERDQLGQELRKGRTFDGWTEGTINFPPTYKYELNSDKYYGEDPRVGRRNPAWCDRILSYGKGMNQLSYKRSELKLSDHRPVTAIYIAEVEVFYLS